MEVIRTTVQETAVLLEQTKQEYEEYNIEHGKLQTANAAVQHLFTKPVVDQNLVTKLNSIIESLGQKLTTRSQRLSALYDNLVVKSTEAINLLTLFQEQDIRVQLTQWKRGQQLSMNGVPFDDNLDQLQDMCNEQAKYLLDVRQQIKRVNAIYEDLCRVLGPDPNLKQYVLTTETQVLDLIKELVMSSFIVDRQPPQVLKTNRIFSARVRLLVGQAFNTRYNPPKVKALVINEAQARVIFQKNQVIGNESSGKIMNNEGNMEYQGSDHRDLSIHFKNLKLEKVKRASRRNTEHVVDEKFTLLFKSEFSLDGRDLTFKVWAMSLPVVTIVHSHQEPDAWATILWDNHFAQSIRVPFEVPPEVRFGDLADALSRRFETSLATKHLKVEEIEETVSGRGLTDEQKKYLAEKALGVSELNDWPNAIISWQQFAKDKFSADRPFTFWEWFYNIVRVCRPNHMRQVWNDGLIWGFIARTQSDQVLCRAPVGTFLIRFSDSALGGVSVAWAGQSQNGVAAFSVKPFMPKDLETRKLADRLNDLKHLRCLYPAIPKDQAFSRYYTKPKPSTANPQTTPYLESHLRTVIPGWSEDDHAQSIAGSTPNGHSPTSDCNSVFSPGPSSPGADLSDVHSVMDTLDLQLDFEDYLNISSGDEMN